MRIAVLSDLHANLEALEAVLARAASEGVDVTYVLGDIVGYGADPGPVVDRVGGMDGMVLAGNHDMAATGRFDTSWFNTVAAEAIRWTIGVLGEGALDMLGALEPRGDAPAGLLVHGSVVDPATEYVTNVDIARASFEAGSFERCFFGHTHLPVAFLLDQRGRIEAQPLNDGETLILPAGARVMLNPGSVGQPRDGDPRASFMIYDDEQDWAVVHRVPYDVGVAQDKIRAAGLPAFLADRLSAGR